MEDSGMVCREMSELLRKKTAVAGVKILRMDFVDLSISSEMALFKIFWLLNCYRYNELRRASTPESKSSKAL